MKNFLKKDNPIRLVCAFALICTFSFLVFACFSEYDYDTGIEYPDVFINLAFISFIVFIIAMIIETIYLYKTREERRLKRQQREEEKARMEEERINAAKAREEERKQKIRSLKYAFVSQKHEIETKYGPITNEYLLPNNNYHSIPSINDCVLLLEEARIIVICNQIFNFKDIIGCSVTDDSTVEKGSIEYETTQSTSDIISRAAIGDLLWNDKGAIIAGTTTPKKTIVTQTEDKIYHDYTIIVNVNRLSSPIVRIPCKSNNALVEELTGLLNVIIKQNG